MSRSLYGAKPSMHASPTESERDASRPSEVRSVQHRLMDIEIREVEGNDLEREFSFSSEAPVSRWFGDEILGHGPDDQINFAPLVDAGSVLMFHDYTLPCAIPVKAWKDVEARKCRVLARFVADDDDSKKALAKIKNKLIRGVSVGYSIQDDMPAVRDANGNVTAWRATKWTVHEVSLTPVPADATVGIGRSTKAFPGSVSETEHSQQGAPPMKFKLKDGREVSLAELENMRLHGDVELADGTILSRSIPASVVEFVGRSVSLPATGTDGQPTQRNNPNRTPKKTAAVVPVAPDEDDEQDERSVPEEDRLCDIAERKRRGEIRNFIAAGRRSDPEAFPEGCEGRFLFREDDKGNLLPSADIRREVNRVLNARRKDDTDTSVVGDGQNKRGGATAGADLNVESLTRAIEGSILMRAGVIDQGGKSRRTGKPLSIEGVEYKPHERSASLIELGFADTARMWLEAHGHRCSGMTRREIMIAAMANDLSKRAAFQTTANYSVFLENTMHKMLFDAYDAAETTWREIAGVMSVNDLRAHGLYKTTGFDNLALIGESGEVPAMAYPDSKKESLTAGEYAGTFRLTERILINDDLGAFTQILKGMGDAAALTVEDWVYYTIMSNPTMNEDSTAFFDESTHANYLTEVGPPSETTYNTAFASMRKKTGLSGRILNLRPAIGLFPASMERTATKLYVDGVTAGATNEEKNMFQGIVKPIINARLDLGVSVKDETAEDGVRTATGSSVAWYLGCDPRSKPGFKVGFLDGKETPEFREDMPIGILGREYQAALRFGVAAAEWRFWFKHKGEN